MKKRCLRIVLPILCCSLSFGLKAQTKNVSETKEIQVETSSITEKKYDGETFDKVKLEVLAITSELEKMGVKEIPEYPKYIDLNSMTLYLEELKVLNSGNQSTKNK